jgi:nucleolar protein 56
MAATYALHESASGYALFETKGTDEISGDNKTIAELERFSKVAKLAAFLPFNDADSASKEITQIADGSASDLLIDFLKQNLPKQKKRQSVQLIVAEPKVGSSINERAGIQCVCNEPASELLRGIRTHFGKFVNGLEEAGLKQAQLGLAHAYSRAKVQHNIAKSDTMIIQSISLLDTLDKDINTFIMRVREWYGWHFPELAKIVRDNYTYSRIALTLRERSNVSDDIIQQLVEIVDGDETKAQEVYYAARSSMGQDISSVDMANIETFARKVISLAEYRQRLSSYLIDKMHIVAPNLSALIGEVVGARLISHASSLANLAKYPASTVQILGAEKALFRALKTKGNTPKYGLIFHSTYIGRAGPRNKGRISRYLANKCSIAARIDCFADFTTNAFGAKLKEQVEERLKFYDEGKAPRKNVDVMNEAAETTKQQMREQQKEEKNGGVEADRREESKEERKARKKREKRNKRKQEASEDAEAEHSPANGDAEGGESKEAKKLRKKEKKRKRKKEEASGNAAEADGAVGEEEHKEKKRRKKEKEKQKQIAE